MSCIFKRKARLKKEKKMKSVAISIIIAVLIVIGSLAYTRNLENVSGELLEMNAKISDCISAEDYSGADAEIERLAAYLDRKRSVLDATGDHAEMDKIEMNISELTEYAKAGQQADALSRCRVLEFLFEHLPLNYKLKFENIL
jgi:hypothetical protein